MLTSENVINRVSTNSFRNGTFIHGSYKSYLDVVTIRDKKNWYGLNKKYFASPRLFGGLVQFETTNNWLFLK